MLNVGVAGATGYTGLQLCQLLLSHPQCTISQLFASRNAGQLFGNVCPYLHDLSAMMLSKLEIQDIDSSLDVLFLALPHATSHSLLFEIADAFPKLKIIDLSADFRLDSSSVFESFYGVKHAAPDCLDKVPYALPELFRNKIVDQSFAAIPGCYATTCILGLYPIFNSYKPSGSIIIDAKSGVSGAGKSLNESFLFCEVNEHFSAYKTGAHRHQAEFDMVFPDNKIVFSPHLIPQSRGILASIYMENTHQLSEEQLLNCFKNFYHDEPFVIINETCLPTTRSVVGSNLCEITPKIIKDGQTIALFSASDNLLKGAAGQSIQALNLMCGFDEAMGLSTVPRII
tara:strand:- start:413 stop:1438 length:1026 start_codon:yes stop_codon:yes gene_type:complete